MTQDLQVAADAVRLLVTPGSIWRAKRPSECATVGRLAFRVKFHYFADNRVEVVYTEGGWQGHTTDLSLFDIPSGFDKVD